MAVLNRLSTEYIWNRITTSEPFIEGQTGVEIAFVPSGTQNDYPQEQHWHEGELVLENAQWWSRVLVGPAAGTGGREGTTLTPGAYGQWVRLTDFPEIPVRFTGTVTIT